MIQSPAEAAGRIVAEYVSWCASASGRVPPELDFLRRRAESVIAERDRAKEANSPHPKEEIA